MINKNLIIFHLAPFLDYTERKKLMMLNKTVYNWFKHSDSRQYLYDVTHFPTSIDNYSPTQKLLQQKCYEKLSGNHFAFPNFEIIKNCCPSCNHKMKFVPIHHRLTFYYHYHNDYKKIMEINFCSKICADDFVQDNHSYYFPSRFLYLRKLENKSRLRMFVIRTKHKFDGEKYVKKYNKCHYRYNGFGISLRAIEDIIDKFTIM